MIPLAVACLGVGLPLGAEEWTDPAPPEVAEVPADAPVPVATDHDRLTFRAPPKPLPEGAKTEDWKRFLGPRDDVTSGETKLLAKFPEGGPEVVWEMAKGSGYTSPVITDGRLVMFDRLEDEEIVECFEPETGKRFWSYRYPVVYRDRYGFSDGPRASAVIDSGKVYTLGVTSRLTCLDLATGTRLWERDLEGEFDVAEYFFGHGACPVIHEGLVIVNVGTDTESQICVAAFDQHDGKLAWVTRHEWNASYASPVVKSLRGEPRLLVFAGGESRPSLGGLLCIDPKTGKLHDAFPWRSEKYESVNGSTPIVVGENRVFISATYDQGGIMVELTEDLQWKEIWQDQNFGMHWMTPLLKDGYLYGYLGRNEPDAALGCYDAATGEKKWQEIPEWSMKISEGRDYRLQYFRGSLLHADGRTYALGELGTLGIFDLSPEGLEVLDQSQLFLARATWSLPVLHNGLLYVSQHEPDFLTQVPARLICYDLRAED